MGTVGHRISDEDIENEVKRVIEGRFRGKIPNSRQFHEEASFSDSVTCKRFGSYRGLLRFAGYKAGVGNTKAVPDVTPAFLEPSEMDEIKVEFPDKKVGSFDWNEFLGYAKKKTELDKKASHKQSEVTATIKAGGKPVAVSESADWHLGSGATDYGRFIEDIRFYIDTPRLYMILVGDLIENFKQFRTIQPILAQVLPPHQQRKVLGGIFTELTDRGKLLAVGYGNHEAFDERLIGENLVARLIEDKVPFFSGKGILNLEIDDYTYRFAIMHKTQYNSSLNLTHGAKRELERYFPDVDFVVTAHFHNPGFELLHYHNRMVAAIRVGTYKLHDGYSNRYWKPGILMNPTTVFFEGRWTIFPTPYEAVIYMRGIEHGEHTQPGITGGKGKKIKRRKAKGGLEGKTKDRKGSS
jgi:hypothetical protein